MALDGRHLLAQHRFALPLVEGLLGLPADLVGDAQHLDPVRQEGGHLLHAAHRVDRFQQLLFLVGRHVEVGGDEVGQRRRRRRAPHGFHQFVRHLRQQLQGFQRQPLQVQPGRLQSRTVPLGLLDPQHGRGEGRPLPEVVDHLEPLHALEDHVLLPVRGADIAQDVAQGADAMEVDRGEILAVPAALHQQADRPFFPHGRLRGDDGAPRRERHGEHRAGEHHRGADGHDKEGVVRQGGPRRAGGSADALGRAEGEGKRSHRTALWRLIRRQPSCAVLLTAS